MIYDLVIKNGTLVTGKGVYQSDLAIQAEKISEIGIGLSGRQEIDAGGKLVIPGGVDPHVHLEMPTPTTVTSDDWQTGSKAAAFGGTTTVIDFIEPAYPGQPLLDSYRDYLQKAQGRSAIDFSFHMTLCSADADTLQQVPGVVAAGMSTFKVYTTYPGFHLSDEDLLAVLEAVAKARGLVLVHSESDAIIQSEVNKLRQIGHLTVSDFPDSRPPVAEKEAIERVLSLASYASAPVYIVHVSTRDGASAIRRARQVGQAAWGETCPQYLLLDESKLKTGGFNGAKFVCSPPLRLPVDQAALWSALQENSLQTVGTDHCAFNFIGQKDLGKDSFLDIPSGLPGIELRLALLYTYGVKPGRLSLQQWVEACSTTPARLFGLLPRKGELSPGADADVVLFDPERSQTITQALLHENVDYTPYEGLQLAGKVTDTFLRGQALVRDEAWVAEKAKGVFLPGTPFQAS